MPREVWHSDVAAFQQHARIARSFAALTVTAIPILWEQRKLVDAADDLGAVMLVALSVKTRAEGIRAATEDDAVKRRVDDALDALDAAKRFQADLRAAIRAQEHADRGTFTV